MIEDYTDFLKAYIQLEKIKIAAEMLRDLTTRRIQPKVTKNPFKNVTSRTDQNIQSSEQGQEPQ